MDYGMSSLPTDTNLEESDYDVFMEHIETSFDINESYTTQRHQQDIESKN